MSQRLASEIMRRAFSSPCLATTLPGTTVTARTSSSGEFSASIRAIASSEPGSVSRIIFLAALDAGMANVVTKNTSWIAAKKNCLPARKRGVGLIRTEPPYCKLQDLGIAPSLAVQGPSVKAKAEFIFRPICRTIARQMIGCGVLFVPVGHNEFRSIARHESPSGAIAILSGRPLLRNTGIPLNLDWVREVRVNTSAVERRAQSQV